MDTRSPARDSLSPVCPVVGGDVGPATPTQTPEPAPTFHLGYRRWLDGLRGVAILFVVALHLRLLAGGNLGVDIFFVLSGFLITSLLVEEWQRSGAIDFKRFYLRRALRLVPAFVVLLLVYVTLVLCTTPTEEWPARWLELAAVAGYVANWPHFHGITISYLGHTWSLSVEEQFYLIWPALLCLMLHKLPRRRIVLIVVIGIVASAALRTLLHHQHRWLGMARLDIMRLYTGLDTRADSLLAGCLASLLVHWNMLPNSSRFLKALTIGSLLGAALIGFCVLRRDLGSSQNYDGLFTLVALATALIIVRLLAAPAGLVSKILESAPLVGVGRISYGWYLFHMPVIEWFPWDGLGWRHPLNTLLVAILSLVPALLSYYWIEQPFLRLKDRLHSSPPAAPEAESQAAQSPALRVAA